MGELIKGNFGKGKDSTKAEDTSQTPTESPQAITSRPGISQPRSVDITKIIQEAMANKNTEAPLGILAFAKALEIEMFLNTVVGARGSRESVETAKKQWESMSSEDLLSTAMKSTATDWQAKPGWYRALAEVLKQRSSEERNK